MPKFCANLTMLWNELDFMDRFAAAANAGFKGVEYLFPYDHDKNRLAEQLKRHGLIQVLHNLPAGDWANGERGIVGFNAGIVNLSSTNYNILMLGPLKDGVTRTYFSQDIDSQLNWTACSFSVTASMHSRDSFSSLFSVLGSGQVTVAVATTLYPDVSTMAYLPPARANTSSSWPFWSRSAAITERAPTVCDIAWRNTGEEAVS